MALAPRTRLGSYDVIALIGQGGMGEVYRAHDTKLGRDVALKVLTKRTNLGVAAAARDGGFGRRSRRAAAWRSIGAAAPESAPESKPALPARFTRKSSG